MNQMRWTDNHCHLPDEADLAALVVNEAKALGVERLIDVGTSVERSATCCGRAAEFDGVWATAGVHPHAAKDGIEGLESLLSLPKVVAVGECGLDYHYDNSPRQAQRAAFERWLELARSLGLPVVVHTRDAEEDTIAM